MCPKSELLQFTSMHASAAPSAADRLVLVLDGLCRAVAARFGGRAMSATPWGVPSPAMSGPMIILIWSRLRRIGVRVRALAAWHRTGVAPPVPTARRPSVRSAGDRESGPRSGLRSGLRLPGRFGWLLPLVPGEAACFAGQLRHVLNDPEMTALIAADPRTGKLLRPLCRMLGVEVATVLPAPVRAARTTDETSPPPPRAVRRRAHERRGRGGMERGAAALRAPAGRSHSRPATPELVDPGWAGLPRIA